MSGTPAHIAGALWIPMGDFAERTPELPDAPLAIVCRSGSRSGVVADWLERSGCRGRQHGRRHAGVAAAGLPIEPDDGFIA